MSTCLTVGQFVDREASSFRLFPISKLFRLSRQLFPCSSGFILFLSFGKKMSRKLLLLLTLAQMVFSRLESLQDHLLSQMSYWCEVHPFGLLYSNGTYFKCVEQSPDSAERKPKEMDSLKGVTLKIGVLIQGNSDCDYDCSGTLEKGMVKLSECYSQYILDLLQEILRFKPKLIGSSDWGSFDKSTGSWTGLVGLLTSNTTDLAVCHWTMSHQLSTVVDYLVTTLDSTESFIYLPQNLPLTQDVFVITFSRRLWIFFVLSIFLLVISFRFSTSMHSSVRPDHEPWSWDEVVLWAVAAISQQSYSRHPRGSSCRTMFLIGYTITYLLYTGFAAGITSLLALQEHQNHLTFDDVVDMKLKLFLHQDEYYETSTSSESKLTFLDLLEKKEAKNLTQILRQIENTNVVGFGSTITLVNYLRRKVDSRKRESLSVFPVPHSNLRKAFLIRKMFPFKRVFDYWLVKLKENGLLDLGEKRFLKVEEAAKYKSAKWSSASLRNVFSAFAFLIGGWLLSIIVFGLEILSKKQIWRFH